MGAAGVKEAVRKMRTQSLMLVSRTRFLLFVAMAVSDAVTAAVVVSVRLVTGRCREPKNKARQLK